MVFRSTRAGLISAGVVCTASAVAVGSLLAARRRRNRKERRVSIQVETDVEWVRSISSTRWRRMAERLGDPKAVMREALVIVMVGLPARGKSFISNLIVRHLRMTGVRVKAFNAGQLRRDTGNAGACADFFSATNKDAKAERERLAMQCVDDMMDWIYEAPPMKSSVAILDATNTTVARRATVVARCNAAASTMAENMGDPPPLRIIFLESMCDDAKMLEENYEMKLFNDDYKNNDNPYHALQDFQRRVRAYEDQYEPLDMNEFDDAGDLEVQVGSLRIINGGRSIMSHCIGDSLVAMELVKLLHSVHLEKRRIILVPEEQITAETLAALIHKVEIDDGRYVDLLISANKRLVLLAEKVAQLWAETEQAATPTPFSRRHTRKGDEPERAVLTLRDLAPRSKESSVGSGLNNMDSKKATMAAESFEALAMRLNNTVLLIERMPRSVMVVCGSEVRRLLLAYFKGVPEDTNPADIVLPEKPVVELWRDHKGFAVHECDLPGV